MTLYEWIFLGIIAFLGHAMALLWYAAKKYEWKICKNTIYELPINGRQLRRELINSIHAPLRAVMLFGCLVLGYFNNSSWIAFFVTGIVTTV